jgi:HTH-type transcriptional regulator/antitoxin HigA
MSPSNSDRAATGSDHYFELIRRFPLRRLQSDQDLMTAIAMIDSLISRGDLEAGEQDYLDILTDTVEKYEADEHPMPAVSDADMLRLLLEDRDMTQSALAKAIQVADSVISEVLRGKRELTRKQVARTAKYFGVSVTAFHSHD